MVDPSLLLSMMLSITVLDLFAFLLQNLLYEMDYKLLTKKINVFSGFSQGDNPCLCLHILQVKIQFLVYINISRYHLVF